MHSLPEAQGSGPLMPLLGKLQGSHSATGVPFPFPAGGGGGELEGAVEVVGVDGLTLWAPAGPLP